MCRPMINTTIWGPSHLQSQCEPPRERLDAFSSRSSMGLLCKSLWGPNNRMTHYLITLKGILHSCRSFAQLFFNNLDETCIDHIDWKLKALLKPLFRHSDQFKLFSLPLRPTRIWLFSFFFLCERQGARTCTRVLVIKCVGSLIKSTSLTGHILVSSAPARRLYRQLIVRQLKLQSVKLSFFSWKYLLYQKFGIFSPWIHVTLME